MKFSKTTWLASLLAVAASAELSLFPNHEKQINLQAIQEKLGNKNQQRRSLHGVQNNWHLKDPMAVIRSSRPA